MYFAIITAGVWEDGDNIYTVFSKIMAIASKEPYHIPIKRAVSRIDILAQSVFFYEFTIGIFILLDLSKNRNFMRGKEYGTANWASVESINKYFMEKEHASWNRVYSEKLRVSMNPKVGINNNVLAIGGSGVGKSFYFLTPNIYQADKDSLYPGSMIFTDPKAELLQKNGFDNVISFDELFEGLLFTPIPKRTVQEFLQERNGKEG